MIIRRQWVGSARVLQVLNLIGPEGPIAPGGGNPREEPRGWQKVSGPQAPQHHRPYTTTSPITLQFSY